MRGKTSANPTFFVNIATIEQIHKQLNIPLGRGGGAEEKSVNDFSLGNNDDDEIQGEEIHEEVVDDFTEDWNNGALIFIIFPRLCTVLFIK